ncbi:hypothetical protein RM53_00980 [Brevundimonas nasdae]|uniref:Uncharacterized protein n=1 Tax=Brevundimonas nasdae TaxID=172043 RepID=A0A0B4D1Z0_9CAUL|nr:hypothetical protein RM53_00980 [Brevundimonas nasdae]
MAEFDPFFLQDFITPSQTCNPLIGSRFDLRISRVCKILIDQMICAVEQEYVPPTSHHRKVSWRTMSNGH